MNLKKRIALASIALAATFLLNTQAWAVSLSFNPNTSDIDVGDLFSVDIIIDGLEFDDLGTFDFNVTYDPSVLSFACYALGTGLGTVDDWDASDWSRGDVGGGTVNLSEVSWLWDLSFQADSFTLATLSFSGAASGTSSLNFDSVILGDTWGAPLQATVDSGSINVAAAPVPEPTTMLLFGTGLTGLIGTRLRKKADK